jgi:hypothetical protein
MKNDQPSIPAWLPELTELVQAELATLADSQQDRQPDLEREIEAIREKIIGWMTSLANKNLDLNVRHALELEWATAEKRVQEIEQTLFARESREQRAVDAVDEIAILQRLQTLSDVLANYGPTRGNLELSLHIDRIICHCDGRVEMRTCKLGALPEVAELLADLMPKRESQPQVRNGQSEREARKRRQGPRRRGRLRTSDQHDDSSIDSREIADFAADTHRFGDLPDKWFWFDEFQIPVKRSWVEVNAEKVLRRRDEIKKATGKTPTLNSLAKEFGKSRPTISTAIEIATGKRQPRDRRHKKRKFTMPLDDSARHQIVQLYHGGNMELKDIGDRCGVHRSTVERVLNDWDKTRGQKRVDGRKRRSSKSPGDKDG